MNKNIRENPLKQSQYGIFYPLGYLVAGFPSENDAQQVRQDLITGGYEENDCQLFMADHVARIAEDNLDRNQGFFSTLGKSDEVVQKHLEEARQGATFLLIYAPHDNEVDRVMNVMRRKPFSFAHRYHRFTIEELS